MGSQGNSAEQFGQFLVRTFTDEEKSQQDSLRQQGFDSCGKLVWTVSLEPQTSVAVAEPLRTANTVTPKSRKPRRKRRTKRNRRKKRVNRKKPVWNKRRCVKL